MRTSIVVAWLMVFSLIAILSDSLTAFCYSILISIAAYIATGGIIAIWWRRQGRIMDTYPNGCPILPSRTEPRTGPQSDDL